MSDILIEVESGKSKRLKTANKLCKDDIVVTGTGGSGGGIDLFPYVITVPTFDYAISEVTENVVLHLERATSLGNLFDLKRLNMPKITVYITDKCTRFFRAFGRESGNIKTIEIIGDTRNVNNYDSAFLSKGYLEEIIADLDFSSIASAAALNNMFGGCTDLKEVRFVPNTLSVSISLGSSPNLSADSIQSIIDGLADLTGGTAQTLTFHATVKAKLTDQQIATITGKNWTLA